MNDFSFDFQNFIDERLNDIIYDLKEQSPKYAACRNYIKENCDRFKSIIENLPDEDREFMYTYEAKYFDRIAFEQGEFYYRGYRDCIKLLEWLGVI